MASLARSSLLSVLQPPERRGLHEAVLSQLLTALRTGQLQSGDRLREVEIAERLNISRGTLREAIRRLEQEGLVVTYPHRGTFMVRLTRQDIAELFSLRRVLEAYAVRLAIPRVTGSALAELTAIAAAMVAAAERRDQAEHLHYDVEFHEKVCLLSGHRHLHATWSRLALKFWLIYFNRQSLYGAGGQCRATVHEELIELLRRQDTEAAVAWIEGHIDRRMRELLDAMSEQETDGSHPSIRNGARPDPRRA